MPLTRLFRSLLTKLGLRRPQQPEPPNSIYTETAAQESPPAQQEEKRAEAVVNLWDYLVFKENTQAHHIVSVLGFEEWTSMDELRRRIKELFGVEYENDRSLYPHIKTLVDAGILEAIRTERRQKWRKRALLYRLRYRKRREEVDALTVGV